MPSASNQEGGDPQALNQVDPASVAMRLVRVLRGVAGSLVPSKLSRPSDSAPSAAAAPG